MYSYFQQELVKQREQLMNTERRIDDINNTLRDTQKNINSIKVSMHITTVLLKLSLQGND